MWAVEQMRNFHLRGRQGKTEGARTSVFYYIFLRKIYTRKIIRDPTWFYM